MPFYRIMTSDEAMYLGNHFASNFAGFALRGCPRKKPLKNNAFKL